MFAARKALWLAAVGLFGWMVLADAEVFPARIFTATQAVAAVAAGDFDPVHSGTELACLMADGSGVTELLLGPSGWTTRTIFVYTNDAPNPWEDPRTRVSLRVGDVLRKTPATNSF